MPRLTHQLSDTKLRNGSKPKDKDYKLYDGEGLRLVVRPTGTKVWQYPYKINGKHNIFTIGNYPTVGLADARKKRDEVPVH